MVSRTDFEGRTVVVTGAGGGLGSAIVALLAERGARVIGCDLSEEALASPHIASRHVFDLLDPAAIKAAIPALLDRDGTPDILINNAGWTRAETLPALTSETIERELDLNLTGVMTFADPLIKAMAARGSGGVVFISSELEEVVRLSERIVIMKDHQKVGEVVNGPDVTAERIVSIIAADSDAAAEARADALADEVEGEQA